MNQKPVLDIKNLYANINNIEILKGLNLKVYPGEVHAIMGPNGSGKSTLSKVLVGHPSYKITSGQILFNNEDIQEVSPEERSHKGLFLAFQYPVEIPGISNEEFLKLIYNTKQKLLNKKELNPIEFLEFIKPKLELVNMNIDFLYRNINEGFSGGEKKRNETDSGLDIDALRTIGLAINKLIDKKKSIILITHYKRILDYIKPNFVHVMQTGKIIKTGDSSLPDILEEKGYKWLENK